MKLRSRTRQKTNLKNVIIVGTSFCLLLAAGIFITINVSDVKETKAASNGDFRTVKSGQWEDEHIWEVYNGSSWESAVNAPNNVAAGVIIAANTIVVLNDEVTIANLEINKSAKLKLNASVIRVQRSGSKSAIIVDGDLDAGTCIITGSSSFSLKSGASLIIGSPQGITKNGKLGNVQVEGSRNYNRGALYIYTGTEMQLAGNGMPSAVNSLVIDNPTGVKLENSLHVLKVLELKNGTLITGDKSLTLGLDITNVGVLNREKGFINGNFKRWVGLDNMEETLFPMHDGITYNAFYFKVSKKEFKGGLFTVNYFSGKEKSGVEHNPDSRIIAVGGSGYYQVTGSEGFSNLLYKLSSTVAVSKTENKNYWTIKQKEIDETTRVESGILPTTGMSNISIRPNPFTSAFELHYNLDQNAETTFEIFSINGQLIHREKFMGQQDQNIYEFNKSENMIAGTYIVNITALGKTETKKIMKK